MRSNNMSTDVILIGAGIMSATLGTMLKELDPNINITLFESLDKPAQESSNVWNNAGTGHSALCELNYTPEKEDETIDTTKAFKVNEQFQLSRQFWSYLVEKGLLKDPGEFIQPLPHMSLVHGEDNIKFLQKRFETLKDHPLFGGMEFSSDIDTLKEWIPLIMNNRDESGGPIAATKIESGTDVNFGALTEKLLAHLAEQDGVQILYNHEVTDLTHLENGGWEVAVKNNQAGRLETHTADFTFIGAGGGALPLLQKSGIPESKHVGGFPVSGIFLVCNNEDVIEKHYAKVYGKAAVGAPPMSVPHLDTRFINGKRSLLFGPFAGFSPKFLKTGSNLDLLGSVKPNNNVLTMIASGVKNLSLTKYLVTQLMQTKEQRIEQLRDFVPDAVKGDWDIVVAGQRVQIIKDTDEKGKGTLQFGTEVISNDDGSIAALLGASPGASTAVSIMLEIVETCFSEDYDNWKAKLKEMIPSYGEKLADNPELAKDLQAKTAKTLKIK